MTDFSIHRPKGSNPRVARDIGHGLDPEPPSHMLPAWPRPEPLPPPPDFSNLEESRPHLKMPVDESRGIISAKRAAREKAYPWWVRLFRFLSQVGTTQYEFADAMDLRLDEIQRTLRQYSRDQQDVTSSFNEQATALNRMARMVAEGNHRLVYYEQHVPQIRRAREEYDSMEKEKEIAKEAQRLLDQIKGNGR